MNKMKLHFLFINYGIQFSKHRNMLLLDQIVYVTMLQTMPGAKIPAKQLFKN